MNCDRGMHVIAKYVSTTSSWEVTVSSEKSSTTTATQLKPERPRSLSLYSEEEQKQRSSELSTVPTPALSDHQPTPLATILRETEKVEKNMKPSPSCSQEVAGTNQHTRLDLKFYHSPLW